MTQPQPQSTSHDYALTHVYASELEYRLTAPKADDPDDEQVTLRWDWRFVDGSEIEVLLGLSLGATQARPEEVRVSYVAVFAIPEGQPARPLRELVRQTAPTALIPYITEAISALTVRGFFGSVVLPPLDIAALLPQTDDQAMGVRQAKDDAAFAALLTRLDASGAQSASRATVATKPAAGGSSRR